MKIRITGIAFALAAAVSAPAGASVVGFQVDRSLGGPQIFELADGTFLGLWRFNTRNGVDRNVGDTEINDAGDILIGFTDPDLILGFYNGPTSVNGGSQYTPLTFGFTLADRQIFPQAVWVNFLDGIIEYQQPNGNFARMNSGSRRVQDGSDISLIPTPAALPLLLAGLGAFGLMARRRKAA